jgi:hypothetical protein
MFDKKNNLGHRENSKTLTGAGIPAGQKFSTGTGPDLAGRLP